MKEDIIDTLSFILPFSNEVANVLCSSEYSIFSEIYKPCIDSYLLDSLIIKHISKKKICQNKNLYYKLLFDLLALIGIIINIAKNTLQNGYLDGILSGISIMLFSFVIPNLFLHKIINYFNIKRKFNKLLFGLFIILILMFFSYIFETMIDFIFI